MNNSSSTSCCDTQPAPHVLTVEQAKQRILDATTPLTAYQQIPLRNALNRVLFTDIRSPMPVPGYDNSAMDGYALCNNNSTTQEAVSLPVVGTSWAGKPFDGKLQAGQCIRIMTGAKMPAGADTVIMQEHVERNGDNIHFTRQPTTGQNVRYAGEDIAVGDTVLSAGQALKPADLGLLASLGIAEVRVFRRLRVAFFSTGDELRSLGEVLNEGEIYDSNRYTLHAMLSRLGVEIIDMGVIHDKREAVRQAFQTAAANADALITSGGVSVGDADFVKQTLEELGQVDFWKIAMKPGHPLAFGKLGSTQFFGLPGNPVSAMVTFYQFVQPALQCMMGQSPQAALRLTAICEADLRKRPGRQEFQRGQLYRENGKLKVYPTGAQGSHILTSMSKANCFIVLPQDSSGIATGETVEVELFAELGAA